MNRTNRIIPIRGVMLLLSSLGIFLGFMLGWGVCWLAYSGDTSPIVAVTDSPISWASRCPEPPGWEIAVVNSERAHPEGKLFHLQKPMNYNLSNGLELAPGVDNTYIPVGTRYQIVIQKAEAFTWEQVMEGIGWEMPPLETSQ